MNMLRSRVPGGLSIRQLVHIGSLVDTGRFVKYDFGIEENLRVYGTPWAPSYDLKNAGGVPVGFYVG